MNFNTAVLGLIEIFSAISIGVFILVLTHKILKWIGRRYYDIQHRNLAYSIFMAAMMFSVGYMVSGVIPPLISSFRLLTIESTALLTLTFIGRGAIYVGIAFSAALMIGFISTTLYTRMTPIDEFAEIKNNNVGVALIVASIIITLTLLSKDGVALILESITPYPDIPPRGI